ncbi:hypothetical protein ACUWEX_11425 [Okibacterium fritillariae]|uniref:hypothetical protein n=1 Tax=Okibacterium fritillariae TaxID=123320 RepID=UPI004055938A
MVFTIRKAVIISTSDLKTDGPNQHIRAEVRCTDGPPDVYDVMILNAAAHRILELRAAAANPALVIAGHLHPYTDETHSPRIELALTHVGLALGSTFTFEEPLSP